MNIRNLDDYRPRDTTADLFAECRANMTPTDKEPDSGGFLADLPKETMTTMQRFDATLHSIRQTDAEIKAMNAEMIAMNAEMIAWLKEHLATGRPPEGKKLPPGWRVIQGGRI